MPTLRPYRLPKINAEANCRISEGGIWQRLVAHNLPVRRCSHDPADESRVIVEWRREPSEFQRNFAQQMIPERTLLHTV